jgi:hypothetical protein
MDVSTYMNFGCLWNLKLIAQLQRMELIHVLPINIFLTFASFASEDMGRCG